MAQDVLRILGITLLFPTGHLFQTARDESQFIFEYGQRSRTSCSISLQNVDIYTSVVRLLGDAKVMPSDRKQLNFPEEEVRS